MEYQVQLLDLCNNSAKILINYIEKFKLLNKNIYLDLIKKICTNINFTDFHKYTCLLKERKLQVAASNHCLQKLKIEKKHREDMIKKRFEEFNNIEKVLNELLRPK
jgi:hypothetical protein